MSEITSRLSTALADRYRIERELGAGGMATVYLAEDLKHERKVAVKVLRSDIAESLGADRFLREIKIAAHLHHPHILPLHDSGVADGFLFYVMPYEEGQSLREKLASEGELPVGDALRLLRDVADALAHAHAAGVVHRDIKPDNVMLSGRHALVTDFGVAKAVSEATGRSKITTAGVALGTPSYMAPEQAAADPHVDHRADIYALGALAYELLTGRPPFTGATPQSILAAHVTQAPDPLTKHRAAVSPQLEQFVMRCLEKKPADRWQTADEMVSQLEALATPSGGLTPTGMTPVGSVRSGNRRLQVGAAVLVGVVIIGAGWLLRPRGDSAATNLDARGRIAVLRFDQTGENDEEEYFGDGIAQDINIQLQKVGGFAVIAHGSSRQYNSADASYSAIASALGARYIIDGSIRRASDQVRISVSLIDPVTSEQLWANDYTPQLSASDIFAIQSEIAQQVALALGATFGGSTEVGNPTSDLEAYNAYLLGRFQWAKRNRDGVMRAIEHFNEAIAIDSAYALAWSGLADPYSFVPWYAWGGVDDAPGLAIATAERAYELDNTIAETAASLAMVHWFYQWDWDGADRLFQRALSLNPQYAAAEAWYGAYLIAMGRTDEGLDHLRTAILLDPVAANWTMNLGQGLVLAGRDAEAVEPLRRWEEITGRQNPGLDGNSLLGTIYERMGRRGDAIKAFGDSSIPGALLVGDTVFANVLVSQRATLHAEGTLAPVVLAGSYVTVGRIEEALTLLQEAARVRDPRLAWFTLRFPAWQPVWCDARLIELRRSMGRDAEGRPLPR